MLSTGRKYHYVDQLPNNYNPNKNLTLLLVHGFPDLWYGSSRQKGYPLTNKWIGTVGGTRFTRGFKRAIA